MPAAPAGVARPNVLLIVADDLGFSDVGAYGGEMRTPNLDRLAAEGMRFTQFYNCAVCQPTRGALYTGLYPRARGDERVASTSGEILQAAGYVTGLFGKWGLSGRWSRQRPSERGFEETFAYLNTPRGYFRPRAPPQGNLVVDFIDHNGKQKVSSDLPDDFYTTDGFSDQAVAAIRRAANSGRPFYFNLCYNAPHDPLHAWPEDIARQKGKYRDGYLPLRERRFQRQLEMGLFDANTARLSAPESKTGDFKFDFDLPDWNRLTPAERQSEETRMEVLAAQVERMDQGIGRVLAALDETGLASRTLVLFMSDNGGSGEPTNFGRVLADPRNAPIGSRERVGSEHVGPGWGWAQNAPFRRHKAWNYEGGICTPMIVRWPGVVRPGSITARPGHLVDIVPTLMELAGVKERPRENGPPLEGISLLPILRGEAQAIRTVPMAWELWGNRAIRDGRWKLDWSSSVRRWELYDLETDRTETNDLAVLHPERVTAMAAAWEGWAQRTNPNGFDPGPPRR